MPYIFGKLWHLAIIWAIRKAFQCILQGVRFLLANQTRLSPTSDNDSYRAARAAKKTTRKTCPLSHLYAGEGGQEVGLVTLGDGTSKQEEKSSNVDPEKYFSQLYFLLLYLYSTYDLPTLPKPGQGCKGID